MKGHRVYHYYSSEGSIWIQCTCGHKINLGARPTPADAATAWNTHEVEADDRKT